MGKQLLIKELDGVLKLQKEKLEILREERYKTELKLDDLKHEVREMESIVESTQVLLRNLRSNKL